MDGNNEIENINMFHSQSSIDGKSNIFSVFFFIKSLESESPNVKQSNQKVLLGYRLTKKRKFKAKSLFFLQISFFIIFIV